MNAKWIGLGAAIICLGTFAVWAQDKKVREASARQGDNIPMGMPEATAEHDIFKSWEGSWDATVDMMGQKTNATETNRVICKGLWLVSDFKGQVGPAQFEGHLVMGYDPLKKKYISTWVDSFQFDFGKFEGSYDEATKTITLWGECPTPSGEMQRMKEVCVMKDNDTRIMTMYTVTSEGKEISHFSITYKRKVAGK